MNAIHDLPPDRTALRDSVERGVGWLESHLQADGSFAGSERDLAGYYKSLLAFAVCGRLESATRCRMFLRANLLAENGELASGALKTSIVRMERNLANYMDGWVAIGAWLQEDFELGEQISSRLSSDQSKRHGGILTGPERWAGSPRYDLATAASCGRAFLFCGRRDAAEAAGTFLREALSRQSDPDRRLELVFDDRLRVVEAPDEGDRTYYTFELTQRGEKVWFPAFSAAFLCELHQVTGKPAYLEAAQRYYEFVERTPEFGNGTLANGKSGWSAGLLALATGNSAYRTAIGRIARNVLNRQGPDGEFGSAGSGGSQGDGSRSPDPMPRRLERTAEFTTWTAEFLRMAAAGA